MNNDPDFSAQEVSSKSADLRGRRGRRLTRRLILGISLVGLLTLPFLSCACAAFLLYHPLMPWPPETLEQSESLMIFGDSATGKRPATLVLHRLQKPSVVNNSYFLHASMSPQDMAELITFRHLERVENFDPADGPGTEALHPPPWWEPGKLGKSYDQFEGKMTVQGTEAGVVLFVNQARTESYYAIYMSDY